MEWWTRIGNMSMLFPDTPALAIDMSLNGPEYGPFAYGLTYNLQKTPVPLEVYPPEGIFPQGE